MDVHCWNIRCSFISETENVRNYKKIQGIRCIGCMPSKIFHYKIVVKSMRHRKCCHFLRDDNTKKDKDVTGSKG